MEGWDLSDAWILAAIGPAQGWVRLRSVVRAADHYNHAVPSDAEVSSALRNLASAGLLEARDGSVRLTGPGRRLWEDAEAISGLDLVLHLQEALAAVRFVAGSSGISKEEWGSRGVLQTIDHASWPAFGRVGICRVGSPAGQHVLLLKAYPWLLYFQEPVDRFRVDGMDLQLNGHNSLLYEEFAAELATAWEVHWLDGEQERQAERQFFDVRRDIALESTRALRRARWGDRVSVLRGGRPWRTRLDDTERAVARLLARGSSDAEIAGLLFLSDETVEKYVRRIIENLGAPDREAVARMVRR